MWDNTLKSLVVGAKVRVFYGEDNLHNEIRHIRAIVDDAYIVYKVWGPRKKRWLYHIKWWYGFYLSIEDGVMTIE